MSNQKPAPAPGGKSKSTKPYSPVEAYRRMILSWWRWPCHECHHPRDTRHHPACINASSGARKGAGLRHLFLLAALGVFVFTYAMSYVQTYASERVARDLRNKNTAGHPDLEQNYSFLNKMSPAQLLTILRRTSTP